MDLAPPADEGSKRPLGPALYRGLCGRCPKCGRGRLLRSYLTTVDRCDSCGEPLAYLRADDAAPWLTIIILGHLLVPSMLIVRHYWMPPLLFQQIFWPLLAAALALMLLPRSKGVVLGLLWVLRPAGSERE